MVRTRFELTALGVLLFILATVTHGLGQRPAQPKGAAAARDGLEIGVRPLKAVFTPKQTVEVEVQLKNVAKEPLWLYYPSIWIDPFQRFLVEDVKTGARWTYALIVPADPVLLDKQLAAGEVLTSKAALHRLYTVPPTGKAPQELISLHPGAYRVRATVELQANPQPKGRKYWSGVITSGWAAFRVGNAEK